MNHIKNYLEVDNDYGVQILFFVDRDGNYIGGRSEGEETEKELEMMYNNLDRMGLIKKFKNKTTHIDFIDGGTDDEGTPIVDLYFRHFDDQDDDFTPVCTITKEFLKELGF